IADRANQRYLCRLYDRQGRSPWPVAADRCATGHVVSNDFGTIVVADFEYETSGGEYELHNGDLPKPLCMVAHVLDENLRHVRTIRLWRDELLTAKRPPFDIGPDTLFVAYSAWAEMTCFKVLGWTFPVHVFDQHTAYLAASNILPPYDPDEV